MKIGTFIRKIEEKIKIKQCQIRSLEIEMARAKGKISAMKEILKEIENAEQPAAAGEE